MLSILSVLSALSQPVFTIALLYNPEQTLNPGIPETKLLAMPNVGAERCQLPCTVLRFEMLGAQETETWPLKASCMKCLLAQCKLISFPWRMGQASRDCKRISNHFFANVCPTSASPHRTGTLRHLMLQTWKYGDRVLLPFILDPGTLMHFTFPQNVSDKRIHIRVKTVFRYIDSIPAQD